MGTLNFRRTDTH